jgi:hypothetical protein
MSSAVETPAVLPPPADADVRGFEFEATDVTGTHRVTVGSRDLDMDQAPTWAVTRSLVARMALPGNVPWALRDEATGAFLDEDRPIGSQLETGGKVTLTPKTHLGGHS